MSAAQRERCCSGVALPADGSLTDGTFDYMVAHCGYVVCYLSGSTEGASQASRLLNRHIERAHPAVWADIEYTRAMSAD